MRQLSQNLLQGISTDEIDLKVKMSSDLPKEIVQNIDDNNCALHVLMNCLCLTAQKGKIFYKHCHVHKAREQMLKTIIESKLSRFFLQLMVGCLIYFTFLYTLFLQDVETEEKHVHSTQESLLEYLVPGSNDNAAVRKPEDITQLHSGSTNFDVNGVIDTQNVQSSEERLVQCVDPISMHNAAVQMVNVIFFIFPL